MTKIFAICYIAAIYSQFYFGKDKNGYIDVTYIKP